MKCEISTTPVSYSPFYFPAKFQYIKMLWLKELGPGLGENLISAHWPSRSLSPTIPRGSTPHPWKPLWAPGGSGPSQIIKCVEKHPGRPWSCTCREGFAQDSGNADKTIPEATFPLHATQLAPWEGALQLP